MIDPDAISAAFIRASSVDSVVAFQRLCNEVGLGPEQRHRVLHEVGSGDQHAAVILGMVVALLAVRGELTPEERASAEERGQ